jgi:uncharacterized membrane protein YfcA
MLLAATLVLTSPRIAEANASKNMYLGAGGVASALILTIAAPVPWTSVAVLASGLLVGSLVGPLLARRVPAGILRWAAAILGCARRHPLSCHLVTVRKILKIAPERSGDPKI